MIALIVALCSIPQLAERIVMLPDVHLTRAEAEAHAFAAVVAGALTGEDAAELEAVAWHESRFTDAVSREAGGLVSCGVMTPMPQASCPATSLVEQYIDGAVHIRTWRTATTDGHTAFIGVAGGYRLIAACAAGSQARGCYFAATIDAIAKRLAPGGDV